MPLLIKKDLDTLMAITQERVESTVLPGGKRLTFSPGSINRLILAIINEIMSTYYERLEEVHLNSFLSTATKESIDLIGELVVCARNEGEEDNSYKLRISEQITALEAANELAIRMTILSVSGVQDVHMQPYTFGTGSFSAFIITEDAVVSEDVIAAIKEKVNDVIAYGTKYEITGPDLVPVEIGVKLILLNGAPAPDSIKFAVKDKLREYINSKNIGEELIINEIIEIVMSVSSSIYDMNIYQLAINNKAVLLANQQCRWNERFIESSKPNAISVI